MERVGKKRKRQKRTEAKGIAVDPMIRDRIVATRRNRNLTQAALAERAKISLRTLADLEELRRDSFSESTLIGLAEALGVPVGLLLEGRPATNEAVAQDASREPPSFGTLLTIASDLDQYLIQVLRSHRDSQYQLLQSEFKDLLDVRLQRAGLTVRSVSDALQSQTYAAEGVLKLPEPDLRIDVGRWFERIVYRFEGQRIEIPKPSLLWDCNCRPSADGAYDHRADCPIHIHPRGAELTSRLLAGFVEVRWREYRILWRNSPALWPPSVDAFMMLLDLERAGFFQAPCRSVLDLGCGTGFLGIVLGTANPNVIRVDFADWLLSPLIYSALNWRLNSERHKHTEFGLRLGLLTDWIDSVPSTACRPYDLVLCNPPYLPVLPGFESLNRSSTVAGTELLVHLIESAGSIGRNTCVQFSDLVLPEASAAAERVGVRLEPLGRPRTVPFRVSEALKTPAYLQALVDDRGLKWSQQSRYAYWHSIRSYQLSRRESSSGGA